MRALTLLTFLLTTLLATIVSAETRLMMVEEDGCPWCERWHREVGEIYDRTEEGKAAPIWLYDINDPIPDGVTISTQPHFTPTFILLVDGIEVNRIEGYPGEGFFWGLLDMMLADLPQPEYRISGS